MLELTRAKSNDVLSDIKELFTHDLRWLSVVNSMSHRYNLKLIEIDASSSNVPKTVVVELLLHAFPPKKLQFSESFFSEVEIV